jgi:hypothetical protein
MKTSTISLFLAAMSSLLLGAVFHFQMLPFIKGGSGDGLDSDVELAAFGTMVSYVFFGFSALCLTLLIVAGVARSRRALLGRKRREEFLDVARRSLLNICPDNTKLTKAPDEYLMLSPDSRLRFKCADMDMLSNQRFELSGHFGSLIFTGILTTANKPYTWHVRHLAFRSEDKKIEIIIRDGIKSRVFFEAAKRALISYGTFYGDDAGEVLIRFVHPK